MTVYGYVRDATPEAHRRTDDLLRHTFELASTLGEVPILLAGDFNILSEHSAALAAALPTGHWHDVAAALAAASGSGPRGHLLCSHRAWGVGHPD